MNLHHIGIVCKNINIEKENINKIHKVKEISDIIFDEEQNANLCFIKIENGLSIELISGEQVKNIIKKGITYYHICYEVKDIYSKIKDLTGTGALLISPPKPARLFNMRKVAFLYVSYGVIELLEAEPE